MRFNPAFIARRTVATHFSSGTARSATSPMPSTVALKPVRPSCRRGLNALIASGQNFGVRIPTRRYYHLRRPVMTKKILLGGVVGGIVLFIWGALAWMVLPLHTPHVKTLPNESAVTAAIKGNVTETGLYFFPCPGKT